MVAPRSRLPTRRNMKQDPNQPSTSRNLETGLVVGMRFNPTDHELVDHYLQRRIALGHELQSDFIHECPDFYSRNEPWVVWQMYGGDDSKKVETLYFFTHRKRLSPTSRRFDRKMGSGTWSCQNPKSVFDEEDDSVIIGTKREFRYEGGCHDSHNEAWLMQEYQTVDDDCDIVLCTLRKSPRKAPPAQSSSVAQKTTLNFRKSNLKMRKTTVDQSKAKMHKKEEIYDREEEDGCSADYQPIIVHMDFELDDHPMLQVVMPSYCQLQDDGDFYHPELLVEDTPAQFEEGNGERMALLLNA